MFPNQARIHGSLNKFICKTDATGFFAHQLGRSRPQTMCTNNQVQHVQLLTNLRQQNASQTHVLSKNRQVLTDGAAVRYDHAFT